MNSVTQKKALTVALVGAELGRTTETRLGMGHMSMTAASLST